MTPAGQTCFTYGPAGSCSRVVTLAWLPGSAEARRDGGGLPDGHGAAGGEGDSRAGGPGHGAAADVAGAVGLLGQVGGEQQADLARAAGALEGAGALAAFYLVGAADAVGDLAGPGAQQLLRGLALAMRDGQVAHPAPDHDGRLVPAVDQVDRAGRVHDSGELERDRRLAG